MSGRDQRIDERHPLLLRVDHADGPLVHDVTENLSAGGLFVRTDRALEVGARTQLLLGFPRLLAPVEITVEVVWTREATDDEPAGVAVRIPPDRPEDRARVARIAAAASAEPVELGARTFHVLVVEDNALVESMYEHALRLLAAPGSKVQLSISYARDGLQALARLEHKPRVDLVVADLFMPVMDGFQLVERIRSSADYQAVPIVAISGGGEEARARALGAGVDVFLKKPVKVQDVLGTVRALLRMR